MTRIKSPDHSSSINSPADRDREEFLAALAHELRDPLAPICAGLELLKLAREKIAPYDEIIGMMERQTRQLVTLVDHLLELSRINRGMLVLKKSRAKLADLIEEAVEEAAPHVREAGHELSISLPGKSIYLEADAQRLTQALGNLICNAAKFARSGSNIHLVVQRLGNEGIVSLSYEGKGAGESRAYGRAPTKGEDCIALESAGAPVGLSLVYSLAELHGGSLTVKREDGRCACILRLPILDIKSADAPLSPEAAEGHRVLIVDDNRDAALMLGKVIELLGNESRTANNGRMAVEVAAGFRPHVILMDLDMPEMDGYEAARLIRRQSWGEPITLVALTGWGQEEDRQHSRAAGFDHHLLKPVEPYALHKLLESVDKG